MNEKKLLAALRAKFRSPSDMMRTLGLDVSLLDSENKTMTIEEILEAISGLGEEDRLELMARLNGSSEAGGMDEPEPFATGGRPRPGGSMDPLERQAADRRRRAYAHDTSAAATADFAKRYPDAAKIGFA
jgi:hypothetical protein